MVDKKNNRSSILPYHRLYGSNIDDYLNSFFIIDDTKYSEELFDKKK